jgi:hypothetical protein
MRLARGRHRSPDEGACVMELASMLAGERFTDKPRCVDPVLAAFLRSFNDRLDHVDRQRLLPYASRAVGTRAGRARRRERVELCLEFAGLRSHTLARVRFGFLLGLRWAFRLRCGSAEHAARCAIAEDRVEAGFALLDRLIGGSEPSPLPSPIMRGPELRVPSAGPQLELDPH